MPADIRQVAELAGVSIATVSHVINNTRYVTDGTKKKVQEAMEALQYKPNSVARSLRSHKSNTIGLIFPVLPSDTSNFFFANVAHGVQTKMKQHGYQLLLSTNSTESVEDEKEQIELFNSKLIDGLILAPASEELSHLKEIVSNEYPVVFIDRRARGYEADCILSDNYMGSYEAVKLLIEKGHRKIGLITGNRGVSTNNDRVRAYKQALVDYGISYMPGRIIEGRSSFEDGYACGLRMLEQPDITALFVTNNILTMGVMGALQERGIRIPEQMAVIGFDDYDWTRITTPPLTVIRQPSYELGEKAAEIMLERIAKVDKPPQEYSLPTELIVRDSC
ncbi:LacI family DNA-binding transcriptional regulator [Paenibacillus sp. R14(2021)]|uniref:LacI family DNA-binding transcriptional regulator n=1 Tax=Paenibacillus sp. R14(2021) TaxID=2859228 RepID=UPI001C614AED|nr:LacI family DNA-binding transcriptional regulator [Paenibacillus sp. R14(2021)]